MPSKTSFRIILTARLKMAESKYNCCRVTIAIVVVGLVLTLAAVLLNYSAKKLNSDEYGLRYDKIQRKLGEEPFEEGLHFGPVGYEFITFPSVYETINFKDLVCINKDGVRITLIVSFQYRPKVSALYRIATEFKDHDGYVEVLRVVAESSIHEACSKFQTYQFPSERGNFTEEIRLTLLERFEDLQCEINDVQVNNFERPKSYEDAVTEKERAREDIQVALNERPRLLTEARTEKRKAEFQANITIAQAESKAITIAKQAEAEAQSILIQYQREAETYADIISASGLNLTTEGFLSYMGIRVISEAKNPVFVGIQSPAKSSYLSP